MEQADLAYAHSVNEAGKNIPASSQAVLNDGTNACAFLGIALCDQLLEKQSNIVEVEDIRKLAEKLIAEIPEHVNHPRSVEEIYEPIAAYTMMRNEKMVGICELSEEFLNGNAALSESGRQEIVDTLLSRSKANGSLHVGIYTCSPYIFVIGCHASRIFLLDTHPVGRRLGGNGNGLLIYSSDTSDTSNKSIAQWIVDRLFHAGIPKTEQHSMAWFSRGMFKKYILNK